ncbi:MAG: potassium transporter [Anaerolineae bacterium]|nr:potassium transporter [Anaerolineae bacterium]MCB9141913.1 potassium transporter [Anaerolineales bacterium]
MSDWQSAILAWWNRRQRRLTYAAPSALRLVVGLGALVLIGTLLLLLPGVASTGHLSLGQAAFTATSAVSVTGLSVITPARDLTLFGQVVLLVLIQLGGVGFMVLAVSMQWLLGRKIGLADRLALQNSMGLQLPRAIVKTMGGTLLGVLVIEGIGALALWLHWRSLLGDGQAFFYGLFHAVSAFCNAGFDLFIGTPDFVNIPSDLVSLSIMGALIVAGGLGIPVWADLLFRRRRWSLQTRVTLIASASLIVLGTVGIAAAEASKGGLFAGLPWYDALGHSLFQSISARTAGFTPWEDLGAMHPASQWVITTLMLVGTAPASMGGGITTGTLAVLVITMWAYARGLEQPLVQRRALSQETVRRAITVLTISVFVVGGATWLMLVSQSITLDDALFSTVSAFATTGLSTKPMTELNLVGKLIIMAMMFWGRLGALTIVVALARQSAPQPITYPEEQLLIG